MPGRRECACAAGSRVSSRDGDCSAGRCASRPGSRVDGVRVSGKPTTARTCAHTRAPLEPSSTDPRYVDTWGRVKPGRTDRARTRPSAAKPATLAPSRRPPVGDTPGPEETCGHWLMRSSGVVSVAGSTRLRRRAQSSGERRISAGQRSAVMADGGRPGAPHTVDDGVDVVRGSQRPALVGHHRRRWKHKRETV